MSDQAHEAIIIGGGIVGSHCALQLAESGFDVLVLEADEIGSKASGRAAGNITTYHQERFGSEASRFGREYYEDLASRRDTVPFHRDDSYSLAFTEEGAGNLRKKHETVSFETTLIEPEEFATLEPAFATEDLELVSKVADAAYTDPEKLTRAVNQDAQDAGASLRIEPVTGLEPTDQGANVHTQENQYHAPVVVVAAGVWTNHLLRTAGLELALKPRTSEIAVLETDSDADVPIWHAPDFSVYGRATPDGRVLFGGGIREIDTLEDFRTRADVAFLEELAEYGPYILPELTHATLSHDRAGRVSATPDHYPYIGETEVDGLYVCAGLNGEGISNGPYAGKVLAECVVEDGGEKYPEFAPGRFSSDEEFEIGNAVEWWKDR